MFLAHAAASLTTGFFDTARLLILSFNLYLLSGANSMPSIYLQLKKPVYQYAIGGGVVFIISVLVLFLRVPSGINAKDLVSHIPELVHAVYSTIYTT